LAISGSLGLLFTFKYFNFFSASINSLLANLDISRSLPSLNILLPVGISFFTFQALGYTIDVYNRKIKAEKKISTFGLYVSFFPQLVAGPIERAAHLLPQFKNIRSFDYEDCLKGINLIFRGLIKKVVIADRLAIYVNEVYNNVYSYNGIHLLIATYFFAFQIYCDFSGYSDIAVGTARILGYDLIQNFKRPYLSESIREFWRRWHISLSTWFRDYLYFPLGGNRCSVNRHYFNLIIVFAISGLWHGANWTFIIWGLFHGAIITLSIYTERVRKLLLFKMIKNNDWYLKIFRIFMTFNIVCLGWIFFRANSLSEAIYVLNNISTNFWDFTDITQPIGNRFEFLVAILSICILATFQIVTSIKPKIKLNLAQSKYIKWSYYYLAVLIIVIFGISEKSQFIYFQF
jgi:D-alanyl-lipoteichoic acid acyltransferase DltB (MBOAT superfamily)